MQKDKENESLFLIQTCLIVSGIISKEGGNLKEIFERIGSGFNIQWEVISTPRGSGLGTASILIAGILKGIFSFFGIEYNDNDICNKVLEIEQILGTGGGWQDTIGGICKGFKLISTEKGIYQNLKIKKLNIKEETLEDLKKRLLLINTGERRLSRTLLKQVIERYIGNNEENVINLEKSKILAEKMVEALEIGNIDNFSQLLNEQWNWLHASHRHVVEYGVVQRVGVCAVELVNAGNDRGVVVVACILSTNTGLSSLNFPTIMF